MELRQFVTDENAVSSTIGVVLMVAVTVILAAAVGAFALGLAESSAEETPSASIEISWGTEGSSTDTVNVTIVGGDAVQKKFMTVSLEGTVIWDDGVVSGEPYEVYDSWSADEITSGDTLGVRETSTSGFEPDDTLKVIWNNGEKSQVLGSGTNS